MAVQEAIERLENSFHALDDDSLEEGNTGTENLTLVSQLVVLVDLYASGMLYPCLQAIFTTDTAIPRIRLRRKSALETLQPLLEEIEIMIPTAAAHASIREGQAMIESVSNLTERVVPWARSDDAQGTESCNVCRILFF